MEDKKYDKIWRNAANLSAAYEDLRQMTALFAQAKDAEKFISEAAKMNGIIENKIKALKETEGSLHLRCKAEADRISIMKEQSKIELESMKQKYIDRYESEYGKLVKETQGRLESLEIKIRELDNMTESKTTKVCELDEKLELREAQIRTLESQFREIGKALTQEG